MSSPEVRRELREVESQASVFRKELSLRDLVFAQVLCVVGSSWVGVAAKVGPPHTLLWVGAMLVYYLPLAAVVIYLNRLLPLEGGLYQWVKFGFNAFWGFLMAWNLWVYAIIVMAAIVFMVPTDIAYLLGPSYRWIPASRLWTLGITGTVMVGITYVAVRGLGIGKWVHNIGSSMILLAYAVLIVLPFVAWMRGRLPHYRPLPLELPPPTLFSLNIFSKMTVGALSGFEYVAILAGETKNASKSIGRSVWIAAPVIALMFILGTSSVLAFVGDQPIDLIGPIPQTFRLGFGASGVAGLAILLVLARQIAGVSLIFTGNTRLPMVAGWDHLLPSWFTRLHARYRTPMNSILVAAIVTMLLIAGSMAGVDEQEAFQVLDNCSGVLYGVTYVALFALPLFGHADLRRNLPGWLRCAAGAGLCASLLYIVCATVPIVTVASRWAFAAKIAGVVVLTNAAGAGVYWLRGRKHDFAG